MQNGKLITVKVKPSTYEKLNFMKVSFNTKSKFKSSMDNLIDYMIDEILDKQMENVISDYLQKQIKK